MKKVPTLFFFFLGLIYAGFGLKYIPHLHLHPLAPLLAIFCYRYTHIKTLYCAAGTGVVIDLLSSDLHFGIYALNYTLTLLLLYPQKRHFFEEKPFAIPLLTFLISALSTLFELLFLSITPHAPPFHGKLLFLDTLLMPLADALYAYLWFFLPGTCYRFVQEGKLRHFFLRQYHRLPPRLRRYLIPLLKG